MHKHNLVIISRPFCHWRAVFIDYVTKYVCIVHLLQFFEHTNEITVSCSLSTTNPPLTKHLFRLQSLVMRVAVLDVGHNHRNTRLKSQEINDILPVRNV